MAMTQCNLLMKILIGAAQIALSTIFVVWFIGDLKNTKLPNVSNFIEEIPEKYRPTSVVENFRQCSRQANKKSLTDKMFTEMYQKCIADTIPKVDFDKFRMGRFGEDKVFSPLKPSFNESECKWMTVGIGGDTNVEKLFHEKYPQCKIYGVEASDDQYLDFDRYGTVIPYGVGVESAVFNLTIRQETRYFTKEVQVLAMADLLDKYIGTRKVHYITIDIEGFEYGILESLINGQKLADQEIVFCQIDAELHHQKGKITNLKTFLEKFDSDDSDYLPIFSEPFLKHQKVTFLNFKDPECEKAFDVELFL